MKSNYKANNEDGYKIDYQEDYNDGDKIRERMDQQFSEARIRSNDIYKVLKYATAIIVYLSAVCDYLPPDFVGHQKQWKRVQC